jgi:hypothetical protein
MRVANGAAEALLRYLATTRIINLSDEAIADSWREVYGRPGPAAHDAFVRSGSYSESYEPFVGFTIRFGQKPTVLGYGPQTDEVCFFVEFEGAAFPEMIGRFRIKVGEILSFTPDVVSRVHTERRPKATVGEDEAPKDRRLKRQFGGGPAGTRVEEF